jgi:hypothetical protein
MTSGQSIIIDGRELDDEFANELANKFEHEWDIADFDVESIEYTAAGETYKALKALHTPDTVIAQINARAYEKHISPEVFVNSAIRRFLASA